MDEKIYEANKSSILMQPKVKIGMRLSLSLNKEADASES